MNKEDLRKFNEELDRIINESKRKNESDEEDFDELIFDLDGSEIEAIFRKYCKSSPKYKKVKELLKDDFEANYDDAEQIMINCLRKIPFEKLKKIVDEGNINESKRRDESDDTLEIFYKTDGNISYIKKLYKGDKGNIYSYSFIPERNETKEECIKILDKWNKEHDRRFDNKDLIIDNMIVYNKL